MRTLPAARYERKFVVAGDVLASVHAVVRSHPAAFRERYPARLVNNVYLDTPSLADYTDHQRGASRRVKARIRWYGPRTGDLPVAAALEWKIKEGALGGKLLFPLPLLAEPDGLPREHLVRAFGEADLPPVLRQALLHREPVLFNRYRRHYFESRDRRFRVTTDVDLEYRGLRGSRLGVGTTLRPAPRVILELKYASEQADDAEVLVQAFPYRLSRFSKYVNGIEALG